MRGGWLGLQLGAVWVSTVVKAAVIFHTIQDCFGDRAAAALLVLVARTMKKPA